MKTAGYIFAGFSAMTMVVVNAVPSLMTPPHFDVATAASPANPWAFYNVAFFQANAGFGASYVRFFVTNNDQRQTKGGDYATTCSSVAFPSDAVNGGTTPQTYTTGPLSGGCENPNATWTWDGKQLESIYSYGSGS